MTAINVTNVIIENNPSPFLSNIQLLVSFECLKQIQDPIEWKLIYVGSAKNEQHDQVLDQFSMGQLQCGVMQFQIQTNPPNYSIIPSKDDILGVTAIILTVSYRQQEFFRCGYYVYNCYTDPELIENDPQDILIDRVQRNILIDKPRITRFNIDWGFENENEQILKQIANNIGYQDQNVQDFNQEGFDNTLGFDNNQQFPNPFLNQNGIFDQLNNMQNYDNNNVDNMNLF